MSEDVTFRISKANLFCHGSDTKHADEDVVILVKKELLDSANERIKELEAIKKGKLIAAMQSVIDDLGKQLAEKDAEIERLKLNLGDLKAIGDSFERSGREAVSNLIKANQKLEKYIKLVDHANRIFLGSIDSRSVLTHWNKALSELESKG